jgi:integrase
MTGRAGQDPRAVADRLQPPGARAVLAPLDGTARLAASLLYGAGLRLMECLPLRVKDVDFDQVRILVRDYTGQEDGATILPTSLIEPFRRQVERVRALHEADPRDGHGRACLPHALASNRCRSRTSEFQDETDNSSFGGDGPKRFPISGIWSGFILVMLAT